jgi:PAS domain S-box-containing protein
VSPQWILYTGTASEDSLEFGWLDAIHPEDRAATLQPWRNAQNTGEYYVEHRIRRVSDGQYRWHQTRAAPLPTREGGVTEWVGTSADIHQLRRLQDSQRVLLAELQHRTRNLLALVQAIMRRSARKSMSVEDFTGEFEQRLRALSRAESLVASTADGSIDMRALIQTELSAHNDAAQGASRTDMLGPPVRVPASGAQVLALALHELTTNAVKYGALGQGQENGTLEVSWGIEQCDQDCCIVLDWWERGVAMPDPSIPRRKGYGSELIERALPYQLNAQTCIEYCADGVHCSIRVPLGDVQPLET